MLNTTFHEMVYQMRKAQKANTQDKAKLEEYVDNELMAFDEMMQINNKLQQEARDLQ